jgi:hypothetical protein
MPLFDVEYNGKVYEVDAPDQQSAVRALQGQPAQQQAPSLIERMRTGQAPQGMGTGTPEQLAQMQQQGQTGAKSMLSGMAEGGRLLKAGVSQLSSNVQDAWSFITKGKPYRFDKATRDETGKVVQREQGYLDSSKALPTIANELIREQVQQESDREKGINIPDRDFSAGATQMGALALGPEAALPRATTFTGALMKNAAAGSVGTAASFDADNNRMTDQAIAAGTLPLLGSFQALAPAVKNMVGRALRRTATGSRTGAAVASAKAALPDVEYSLAQRTGIPELVTLERRAYDSREQNFYADQTDKFIAGTVKALQQPMKAGQSFADDFAVTRTQAEQSLKALRLNASNAYERGINSAKSLANRVTQGGNAVPVPTPKFVEAMTQVFGDARNAASYKLASPLPEGFMKKLEQISQGGATKPADIADVLVQLTRLQKDTSNPVAQALASRIRGGLDDDLEGLAQQLEQARAKGQPTAPAIDDSLKTILDTRAEYRRAMQAAEVLGESAAYKLLGVGEDGADASQALAKLKAMTPEQRGQVRTFMETNSPDLLVSLKDATVKDAVARAGTIRAAADSQQDVNQLLDAMFDPKRGYDMRTSGVWNSDELKKIEGIKNGMRTVANNRPGTSGSGTPITPEDTAINLISQHSAFLARYMTRVLMSGQGSRFFVDPKLYERMLKINRSTTGSPSNLVARAALLDYLQTDYVEQEQ